MTDSGLMLRLRPEAKPVSSKETSAVPRWESSEAIGFLCLIQASLARSLRFKAFVSHISSFIITRI
ncbi:MAG: hypothetical protein A2Z83_04595 [Omnitrophica bacterium GWA2_52_8]|nr:MAG: hypothetical protein A2Z83_04595 [Omnitrophica bacterium GWA2_52_8]